MNVEYKTLFPCDPRKNRECRKTGCYINGGPCHQTTKLKYAKISHPADYGKYQRQQTADLVGRVNTDLQTKGK